MNPVLSFVAHLSGGFVALAAGVVAILFVLSFVAWCEVPPSLRSGPARPRPWLLLALFTALVISSRLLLLLA
jgi:hypothetical protein